MKNRMYTADIKFLELCDEIDHWKSEADYYKNLYEEIQADYSKHINKSLADAKKGVANALMFALSVEDQPDGSLVINKENRKTLSDKLKK